MNISMRVCVVSPLYHPTLGGLGRQAQLLSERLAEEGVVALVGHKLISLDKEGKPEIHAQLELQTNSEIARAVARSQKGIISEYLLLKSEVDVAVAAEFKEWYDGWRMKTRADPEKKDLD